MTTMNSTKKPNLSRPIQGVLSKPGHFVNKPGVINIPPKVSPAAMGNMQAKDVGLRMREWICKEYRDGLTIKEVSEITHLSESVVRTLLDWGKVKLRDRANSGRPRGSKSGHREGTKREMVVGLLDLVLEGKLLQNEVAARCKVSPQFVSQVLRQYIRERGKLRNEQ